jgi:hypothetical protein
VPGRCATGRHHRCYFKWRTPTFTYQGNIASFNPRSKKHVSLMFHTGATIPGQYARLHATGSTAAYMTFTDPDDFEAAKDDLRAALQGWIDMKGPQNPDIHPRRPTQMDLRQRPNIAPTN